jgi:hypothetical protein
MTRFQMSASTNSPATAELVIRGRAHAGSAVSLVNRVRLQAAAARAKSHPTRFRPWNLAFSCPAIVSIQPKLLRSVWMRGLTAWRGGRPPASVRLCSAPHGRSLSSTGYEILDVISFIGSQVDRFGMPGRGLQ